MQTLAVSSSLFPKRLAIVLMCAQTGSFVAALLASDLSFLVWRTLGIGTAVLAAISAVTSAFMVLRGLATHSTGYWICGCVLLSANVLPYVALMIAGKVAGLP